MLVYVLHESLQSPALLIYFQLRCNYNGFAPILTIAGILTAVWTVIPAPAD